jgi:hypothetical protein
VIHGEKLHSAVYCDGLEGLPDRYREDIHDSDAISASLKRPIIIALAVASQLLHALHTRYDISQASESTLDLTDRTGVLRDKISIHV